MNDNKSGNKQQLEMGSAAGATWPPLLGIVGGICLACSLSAGGSEKNDIF
jgi:hypothetical protein